MKRHIAWGFVGVLVLAGAAMAQETPSAPPAQQNQPGQRPGRGGRMGGAMMGSFQQYLNLTPDQQNQVRDIMQKARQERPQGGGARPSPEERQKMQELRQQLDDAAKAGDDAKVEQLQAEMQNSGPRAQFRQQQTQIYDQVAQILTPEQKAKFAQWRTLNDANVPPTLINDPEALKKAVEKITTLSDMQKNQIDASFERYNRDANSPSATAESKQASALKTASDVIKELKPSQKVLLTAGMRQGGPGGRQGRRGGDQQPGGAGGTAPADGGAPGGNAGQ